MSLDVMKQALESLEDAVSAWRSEMEFRSCIDAAEPWAKAAESLRAAIEQTNDSDEVEALRESLREHMAEIKRLRAVIETNLRDDRRGEKNT